MARPIFSATVDSARPAARRRRARSLRATRAQDSEHPRQGRQPSGPGIASGLAQVDTHPGRRYPSALLARA